MPMTILPTGRIRINGLLVDDADEPSMKKAMIEMINSEQMAALDEETMQRILTNIFDDHQGQKGKRIFPYKWVAVAAILIGLLVGSYFIFFNKQEELTLVKNKPVPVEIEPGKDGAILTLANGRKIVLDNAQNGKIKDAAVKNCNLLSYDQQAIASVEQNLMSKSRGRQYSF
jgi:transmembrane sensor